MLATLAIAASSATRCRVTLRTSAASAKRLATRADILLAASAFTASCCGTSVAKPASTNECPASAPSSLVLQDVRSGWMLPRPEPARNADVCRARSTKQAASADTFDGNAVCSFSAAVTLACGTYSVVVAVVLDAVVVLLELEVDDVSVALVVDVVVVVEVTVDVEEVDVFVIVRVAVVLVDVVVVTKVEETLEAEKTI